MGKKEKIIKRNKQRNSKTAAERFLINKIMKERIEKESLSIK